jgi:CRP/FNR family transcriptional regulator
LNSPGFFALRSGVVKVGLTSANGREIVLYRDRVRRGEICLQTFSCLIEGKTYAAEGVAENDIEALLIPPKTFDRLLAEDLQFRSAVLASVASRLGDFELIVQALAFTGLEARVAAALLRMSPNGTDVSATHAEIAAEIGSAREVVSRQLNLFARQGAYRPEERPHRLEAPGRNHPANRISKVT